MNKTLHFVGLAVVTFTFLPLRVGAYQASAAKMESTQEATAEARKAATEAELATRKAATAIGAAMQISASEDAHVAADRIRTAIANAHDAAKDAEEKTERAYQKAVTANRDFAAKAKEAAAQAAKASEDAVQGAESWLKAAGASDKLAVETTAAHVRASLQMAEMSAKDAMAAGNAAAKNTWKKDMAKK